MFRAASSRSLSTAATFATSTRNRVMQASRLLMFPAPPKAATSSPAMPPSATGAPADFVAKGDPRTYKDLVTPQGLRDVAKYAKYLGPEKGQIIPLDAAGNLTQPTALVADAHKAGLKVQPYTFRNENPFLPANLRSSAEPDAYGDVFTEEAAFLKAGVDGFFADRARR